MKKRSNSFGFCGGAFGDEGKGRIVDEYVSRLARKGPVVVYRDNGGANAGHTVSLPTGERVALHQLPSGIFCDKAIVVLGKGMVIHPGDLMTELSDVAKVVPVARRAQVCIDELAVLSLDTHRAFESALKSYQTGSKGSTGRGIAPAYADLLLRHPLRVRDLKPFNTKKIEEHYHLYEALSKGLGVELAEVEVPTLAGGTKKVGSLALFTKELAAQAAEIAEYIDNAFELVHKTWKDPKYSFVFEKAQAVGLDNRWGVYPDVTASDTTFDGIYAATEGVINPDEIRVRAAVIKATYMSSVGSRKLPTVMPEKLAARIREDAHEYGATTKRPRDVVYLDLPAIRFFLQVGNVNTLVLTHMDISYTDVPVKVCTGYTLKGKPVPYRPDQEYLNTVKPVYETLDSWDPKVIQKAKNYAAIPSQAKKYLKFVSKELGVPITMITTGPTRSQSIRIPQ